MSAYMPASQTDDWATPQNLFDELDAIHNFTLDVAASSTNHKTAKWFGLDHDSCATVWQCRGLVRACGAIRRMVESLNSGLRKHTRSQSTPQL